jgi:two-component system phosphate regulon sensor histidine kinase PhoR
MAVRWSFEASAISKWGWISAGAAAIAAWAALAGQSWAAAPALAAGAAGIMAARQALRPRTQPAPQPAAPPRPAGLVQLVPFLEALPEPALLIDEEGRVAGSNAAARDQFEFEAAGLILSSLLRHPDLLDAVRAAAQDGAARTVQYETAAHVEQHTRCYVAPVTWGEARAAMMVFHDQTARINTERMRADFLANASHELRTPLTALSLLLETLQGPARESVEDRDRFVAMMQVQVERMRRLVYDLLALSRIELDEHVPPADRADLTIVASEVADVLAPVAAERGVKLNVTASGPSTMPTSLSASARSHSY